MKLIATAIAAFILTTMTACAQTTSINNKKSETMATIHLTSEQFKEKVFNYEVETTFKYKGDKPAIVDFYATWCGPCRALAPILEDLAAEYEGKVVIYKVDVDQNPELSNYFGIRSIPTLLFIPVEGKPSMSSGAPTRPQLKSAIEQLIK